MDTHAANHPITRHIAENRWEGVQVRPYKEDGTLFRAVSRQVLFEGGSELKVELRCFEVGSHGHTTLERHRHEHVVTVISGSGKVLVGDRIFEIGNLDVVNIPPMTWHQFRAGDAGLGFLCIVNVERDRPQRPNDEDLRTFNEREEIAQFICT